MKKMYKSLFLVFMVLFFSLALSGSLTYFPVQPRTGETVTFKLMPKDILFNTIKWRFGDGSPEQTTTKPDYSITHAYAAAGAYTVIAEYGRATDQALITVTNPSQNTFTLPNTMSGETKLPFSVTFINLYFAGGKADVSVVKGFSSLTAYADLQVEGSGTLQWQWLVDDVLVRTDSLAVTYGKKCTIDSGRIPGLPTEIPGNHRLTLRFLQPTVQLRIPIINYFVVVKDRGGPAPIVSKVTPDSLDPGTEYKLQIEGVNLTLGTEISFPAPVAVVKKAEILSATQAQVTIFVPLTTAVGVKLATARNENGASTGPGQVTIKVARMPEAGKALPKQPFAVTFINFYFAGGKADVSVVKGFSSLTAYADLQVEGSGTLQWQWLVDDVLVRTDSLAVTYGKKCTIDSGRIPGLPTEIPGNHRLTLRFLQPTVQLRIPIINYFVVVKDRGGPAPIVSKVTPDSLDPGTEYKLQIEGVNLTLGTEISFPAPVAVVKKAEILSATQAQVTIFVPLTTAVGAKLATAKNENGASTGPGQVTIKVARMPGGGKALPKLPPWASPFGISKGAGLSPVAKKGLKISGEMCFYDHMLHINIWVNRFNIVSQDYKPVSGALVKLNSMMIPENLAHNLPGDYYLDQYDYPAFVAGQPIKVSVSVDGETYVGMSDPVSRVELVNPKSGDQVDLELTKSLDAQWKWTGVPRPVAISVYQVVNNQMKVLGHFHDVMADHVAFPTSGWPANVDLVTDLRHDFADIVFPSIGELQENCQVRFWEYDAVLFNTQTLIKEPQKPAQKDQQPLPPSFPIPPKPSAGSLPYKNWFYEQLKKTPRIEGAVNLSPSLTPGKVFLEAVLAITLDGQTVNGADVKVNGVKLEQHQIFGYYGLYAAEISYIPSGQVTVTVTVNGITYNGVGTYNNLVFFTKPPNNSSVILPTQSQIYFQWQYNNGLIEPVDLIIQFWDNQKIYNIFAQEQILNDHISVSTANIPSWPGYLSVWLCKHFPDIVFDGFAAYTANVKFYWGGPFGLGFHPQLTLYSGPIGIWW